MKASKLVFEADFCPSIGNILMALYVLFEMIVRRINKYYHGPIPASLISTTFCLCFGTLLYYCELLGEDYQGISYIPPQDILAFFMPIYATSVIYQMDFFLYTKALQHVCFICVVVLMASSSVICVLIIYVLHTDWVVLEAILATLTILPVQPVQVIVLFRALAKYKNIATILEAESVGTFLPIYIFFQYFRAINSHHISAWFHHLIFLSRHVLGGLVVGGIIGKMTVSLLSILYNESLGALCFLLGMIFLTYYLCEYFIFVSGNLAIVFMASYIVVDRHKFSAQVDENILQFLQSLQIIVEVSALCFYITESVPHFLTYFTPTEIYSSLILFFSVTFVRSAVFILFVYFLKNNQMDIDYDIRTGLVLGLSGLKGSFNLLMAFILLVDPHTFALGRQLVTEILFIYLFTLVSNGTPMCLILRLTGLTGLSAVRRTNMDYCMKYIMEARSCIFKILKTFKYLSDTNWETVRTATAIEHPYKDRIALGHREIEEKESDNLFRANSAICPDCLKEIPYDMTDNEIEELCVEAKSKILKAKKMSVIRQFETGAINKNCVQVLLHNIDMMLDTKVSHSKLDVDLYLIPNVCLTSIRDFLVKRISRGKHLPPIASFRRFCFFLTHHNTYDYTILAIVAIYLASVAYSYANNIPMNNYQLLGHILGFGIFATDLLLRICALRKLNNLCNEISLICGLIIGTLEGSLMIAIWQTVSGTGSIYSDLAFALRTVSLMRIFQLLNLAESFYPHIVHILDRKIDMKITFGFDLAAALECCCNEIIETLGQTVEIKLIRDIYGRDLKRERNMLVIELQRIQKYRPWIAITMKTKQVIRTTLNAMIDRLNELKNSGYVDNIEFNYLEKEIDERIKVLRSIRIIRPSPPNVIFHDIPWLIGNKQVADFLYEKTDTRYYDIGDIVIREGQISPGIFVVLTGVLKLRFKPKPANMENLQNWGAVPIVDYLSTLDFETAFDDDIMSGSTFGEKCFLTRRKYDCSIVADSPTQAYLLPHEILVDALQMCCNPVVGLEAKMWKCACITLAVAIMAEVPIYQTLTQQEIKFKLDRAFVPNLKCYKVFVITELMDDVLLIEGIAMDYSTNDIFYAPMAVPRNVQKLFVSKSSYLEIEQAMDTKLLVIPVPDVRDIEVMMGEEEQADLVSYTTSKCILHDTRELADKKPRARRRIANEAVLLTSASATHYEERSIDLTIINLDAETSPNPSPSQ